MSDSQSHLEKIRDQFTRQAEVYARMKQATDEESFRKLISLAQAQSHHKVLDVACGPGFLTMVFAEHCAEVVGFDATDKFLSLARVEAERRELRNLTFQKGDAEKLPFASGTFDVALCRAAFHHMPHPDRVLAEMKRVTKPDGRVLILDMLTSEDSQKAEYHNRIERLCDPTHTRALAESEFDRMFADAGLQVRTRVKSLIHYNSVEEWIEHGGPSEDAAREIIRLLEDSLNVDRTGLHVRREEGKLRFSHSAIAFVATPVAL